MKGFAVVRVKVCTATLLCYFFSRKDIVGLYKEPCGSVSRIEGFVHPFAVLHKFVPRFAAAAMRAADCASKINSML